MITSGELAIDPERYEVTVAGEPVDLTYLEFNALRYLAELNGRIATYDGLAAALWSEDATRTRRRLAVLISRIRSKLGAAGAERIRTVRQVGYRLTEPPQAIPG